jgi:DNA-binding CsgD family transcriptional regulator
MYDNFPGRQMGKAIRYSVELLERETELEKLAELLNKATSGYACIALVSGEAGIGKTSLVRQFINGLEAHMRVLWGSCESWITPSPFGPLYDMAQSTSQVLLSGLDEGRDWLSIVRIFLEDLKQTPSVAVFEDIHWADAATLDLIKYIGKRFQQHNSLLILTYRDDELSNSHPLRVLLGDLATTGILHFIPLQGLSVEAVRRMAINKKIDALALHHQTQGNPFFIGEVLDNTSEDTIPATIRDAVLARVARLSLPARSILEAAAVIGTRVEAWLLAEVSSAQASEVEECIEAGVLQAEGGKITFRHELGRQVILAMINPSRLLELNRLVLKSLKTSPFEGDNFARLAHHAEGAGDHQAILNYSLAAARQAAARGAHHEAVAHYQAALDCGQLIVIEEKAELLERLSFQYYLIGRIDEAIQTGQYALKIWQSLKQRNKEGDSLRWLSRYSWFKGHTSEAEIYADQAILVLEDLPPGQELAAAYSNRSQLGMLSGDTKTAVDWGTRAIELSMRLGLNEILGHALNNVGSAEAMIGLKEGWEKLNQSLQIALKEDLPHDVARAYTNLASIAIQWRDYKIGSDYLNAGIDYSYEYGLDTWFFYLRGWRARLNLEQGYWDKVEEDAIIGIQANYTGVIRLPALTTLGHLWLRQGDARGEELLLEAKSLAENTGELQRIEPVSRALAESAWLKGDLEQAGSDAAVGYELAQRHPGNPWVLGEMAYWMWRAGKISTPPAGIAAPFELQIRGEWQAAAAEWEVLGCPYDRAWALADGDRSAQLQALEIFEKLGAIPARDLLRKRMKSEGRRGIPRGPTSLTRHNPFRLTPRQLEIVGLIAKGLSNNEIAEQLVISQRTVEHHVSAILGKLEANTRAEVIVKAWEQVLIHRDVDQVE